MNIQMQRIRRRIKAVVGQTVFGTHLHHLLLGNAAIVVAFHRVNDSIVDNGLICDVDAFKRYCRFFSNYFNVVSLRDIVEKMESGVPLNRELAITFDDGYRDNYEYAAPLLKGMGLPATFFVVTQFIGTESVPWWDKGVDARQSWMTWDQVRWLCREGFEIGAHTRTHADLGKSFREEAREEIVGSRLELEEKLCRPVDLFAYPYGGENHITEENRQIVIAAGLRCCCSCYGGINVVGTDPFHLKRIPVSSWYAGPPHFGYEIAMQRI